MVNDDQLHGIKRMRASGHTHQEIADRLNLKRSTVAYQLKKLKDQPEDSSIEITMLPIQMLIFEHIYEN